MLIVVMVWEGRRGPLDNCKGGRSILVIYLYNTHISISLVRSTPAAPIKCGLAFHMLSTTMPWIPALGQHRPFRPTTGVAFSKWARVCRGAWPSFHGMDPGLTYVPRLVAPEPQQKAPRCEARLLLAFKDLGGPRTLLLLCCVTALLSLFCPNTITVKGGLT